ncbi:MAG TPA: type VI secretion system lipoprotein TssJ [Burkholderiales bacterium]|nr:type VI secretion system lipoprotein TssJ [Burkholderiales bacterium]
MRSLIRSSASFTLAASVLSCAAFAQVQVTPAPAPAPVQQPGIAVQIPGVPMSPTISVPIPGLPGAPPVAAQPAPVAAQPGVVAPAPAAQPAGVAVPIPGVPGSPVVTVPVPGQPAPAAAAPGAVPVQPGVAPAPPAAVVVAPAAAPQPPAPPKPSVAELSFVIDPNVNPDATGRPSPVVVRIYELKSLAAFNRADFFSLYEKDREQLGPDLVNRDELPLMPGAKPQAITTLKSETRYVGIVAAFRDIERARWRASTPIFVNQTTRMEIKLDRNEVAIRLQ